MPSDFNYPAGNPPSQPPPQPPPQYRTIAADPYESPASKYPVLRTISVIFKVLAIIAAVVGVIGALVGLVGMGSGSASSSPFGPSAAAGSFFVFILSLVYGGVVCVYFLAISEAIRVFIDIEENTRLTNEFLRRVIGAR